jgi:hypothetical protein
VVKHRGGLGWRWGLARRRGGGTARTVGGQGLWCTVPEKEGKSQSAGRGRKARLLSKGLPYATTRCTLSKRATSLPPTHVPIAFDSNSNRCCHRLLPPNPPLAPAAHPAPPAVHGRGGAPAYSSHRCSPLVPPFNHR